MARQAKMDTRIARRLQQKKQQLDAYRPLPAFTVQRLHDDLRVMLTYNSNAIEGNTLSLAETLSGSLCRKFSASIVLA